MHALSKALLIAHLLYTASVTATETFTGSWEQLGQNESGLWLDTEQNKNTVKFQLEVSKGAPSYNSGWIQGEVELKNNVGHFRKSMGSGLCEISFHFKTKSVELKQSGDYSGCGFGYSVFAIGVLKRTSHKQPKFCAGDPGSGACDHEPR